MKQQYEQIKYNLLYKPLKTHLKCLGCKAKWPRGTNIINHEEDCIVKAFEDQMQIFEFGINDLVWFINLESFKKIDKGRINHIVIREDGPYYMLFQPHGLVKSGFCFSTREEAEKALKILEK